MRFFIGIVVGIAIGFGAAWAIFTEPWDSTSGPSTADAEAHARREALTRERGNWTVGLEVRGVECEREGERDTYSCAVALNVPRPNGGEAFVTLAIYNDKDLVVRSYREPPLP